MMQVRRRVWCCAAGAGLLHALSERSERRQGCAGVKEASSLGAATIETQRARAPLAAAVREHARHVRVIEQVRHGGTCGCAAPRRRTCVRCAESRQTRARQCQRVQETESFGTGLRLLCWRTRQGSATPNAHCMCALFPALRRLACYRSTHHRTIRSIYCSTSRRSGGPGGASMLLATLDSLACAAAAAQGNGCPCFAYYAGAAGLPSPGPQQAWVRPQTPSHAVKAGRSCLPCQHQGAGPGATPLPRDAQLFQAVRPWRWCHNTEGRGLVATHPNAPYSQRQPRETEPGCTVSRYRLCGVCFGRG